MEVRLPSFSHGFPVKIVSRGKTIIIDKSWVRVEWRGLRSLLQRDWRSRISEFEGVAIEGTYRGAGEDVPSRVVAALDLLHQNPRKNVRRAATKTEGLDEPESFQFYTDNVESLRRLWADATRALSLQAIDLGLAGIPSFGDSFTLLGLSDPPSQTRMKDGDG